MSILPITVYEVLMSCTQWKPEHYCFRGRDSRGRLRVKAYRPSGSYFLRWSVLGQFTTIEEAQAVCERFHSDDPVNNNEFIIREYEVTRRLVSSRSNNFRKTVWRY